MSIDLNPFDYLGDIGKAFDSAVSDIAQAISQEVPWPVRRLLSMLDIGSLAEGVRLIPIMWSVILQAGDDPANLFQRLDEGLTSWGPQGLVRYLVEQHFAGAVSALEKIVADKQQVGWQNHDFLDALDKELRGLLSAAQSETTDSVMKDHQQLKAALNKLLDDLTTSINSDKALIQKLHHDIPLDAANTALLVDLLELIGILVVIFLVIDTAPFDGVVPSLVAGGIALAIITLQNAGLDLLVVLRAFSDGDAAIDDWRSQQRVLHDDPPQIGAVAGQITQINSNLNALPADVLATLRKGCSDDEIAVFIQEFGAGYVIELERLYGEQACQILMNLQIIDQALRDKDSGVVRMEANLIYVLSGSGAMFALQWDASHISQIAHIEPLNGSGDNGVDAILKNGDAMEFKNDDLNTIHDLLNHPVRNGPPEQGPNVKANAKLAQLEAQLLGERDNFVNPDTGAHEDPLIHLVFNSAAFSGLPANSVYIQDFSALKQQLSLWASSQVPPLKLSVETWPSATLPPPSS